MSDNKSPQAEPETAAPPTTGCGPLARYPVLSVFVFAGAGLALGLGLSTWDPEDSQDKSTALQWIGLIGDMFIRALKATVLPLVFVSIILSVVDMMQVGRASSIGGKTIGIYFATTFFASILGLISILCFKSLFTQGTFEDPTDPRVQLGCGEGGSFLSHDTTDGSVMCSANLTEDMSSYFFITDLDGSFVMKSSGPRSDISMSDTVYDGVFRKLITSNIFESFVEANFAAVVFFAIFFGAAMARVLTTRKLHPNNSIVVGFLKESEDILITLINWVIMITPFAVFSLIANAIGKQSDLKDSFANVGYLVAATLLGLIVHVVLVYVIGFALLTKSNPFDYLKHLIPAQTTAFACASSAATIPVTLQCCKDSGRVPDTIAKFVVPMGATINMDGSAIYFPCACIWMAILNGEDPNFGQYIMLIILATVGSAGSAPVPSAALVLIISAYNTVFGTTGTPDGFSFIIAIDWFMDRCRTTVNVTGDAIVTGMVSHLAARDGVTFGDESAIPGAPESTLAAQSADDDSGECDA